MQLIPTWIPTIQDRVLQLHYRNGVGALIEKPLKIIREINIHDIWPK